MKIPVLENDTPESLGARVLEAASVGDRPEADASFTQAAGAVCAIQVADFLRELYRIEPNEDIRSLLEMIESGE